MGASPPLRPPQALAEEAVGLPSDPGSTEAAESRRQLFNRIAPVSDGPKALGNPTMVDSPP